MQVLEITTQSGSIYRLRKSVRGRWYLAGKNVPSSTSQDIQAGEWEVELPTVPTIGQPFRAYAPESMDRNDPARIPGGGKITSPITNIEIKEL